MANIDSLRDIIEINDNFKTSINLYLSLNNTEKILSYIPTKSSIRFLGEFAKAVLDNKEQATLLVGPYGKGKSHLLLVFLSFLSLDRNLDNEKIINQIIDKIRNVDEIGEETADQLKKLWDKKKFLPVLISDTTGDLNQAFLFGLNDALKREGLLDLIPDTYYSNALERIDDWEENYWDTFIEFSKRITQKGYTISDFRTDLRMYSKEALNIFKDIYPKVTAGSEFNPLACSDVLPLYKSATTKLVEDYNFSGIYIVFDEFSKYIESQDGSAVGANMKLIQDICELATDSKEAQVFFTMVAHKSIKEYGKYLTQDIINSFTGIEGRIVEKFFITSSKNNYELIKNAIIKNEDKLKEIPNYNSVLGAPALEEYYQLPVFRSNFIKNEFNKIILEGCYPLNPIVAYILLNISEKIAQNERTLFTFISNNEPYSMVRFIEEHTKDKDWIIGSDLIYDYFNTLLKKEVSNEYIHSLWLSAEYAIEKCQTEDQKKLVKALATVLIVNKEDELPASDKYLNLCVMVDDCAQTLAELVNMELIYKKNSTGNYVFKTVAGIELRTELRRQRELKGDNVNYARALLNVTGKYYILPRKYNSLHMMTRYFTCQYICVDDFLNINSADALMDDFFGDGKVIYLFGFDVINQELVKKHVLELAEPRLVVVCPEKAIRAEKQLKDYEIILYLEADNTFTSNNEILKKELPLLEDDLTTELELLINEVFDDSYTKVFYFEKGKVKDLKSGNEELAVNDCCEKVYVKSPIVNNEMVNRNIIRTSQTKRSRINIIRAIISHEDNEAFYQGRNQEATIYRSLFCVTNIINGTPSVNLNGIIQEINGFVDSCSDGKVSVSKLIQKLTQAPYGMRLGLIPFYLAYVISYRREDIIVYFSGKEIQLNAEIVVRMCEQPEDFALYVSKEDLQKEKYIRELNRLFQVSEQRNLSANRIKDIFICMQRWFRALPLVARNNMSLLQYVGSKYMASAMQEIKKALQQIEFNPFECLFIEFPKVFQSKSFEDTFKIIDECKTYYDNYFDWVQSKAVEGIYHIWGEKRKNDLFHCLKEWYEKQSKKSKQGLYGGRVTNFMSAIEMLNVYSDFEVAQRIVKAVTDIYIENWNEGSLEEFLSALDSIKKEIEFIKDDGSEGEMTLSFTRRNGEPFVKTYNHADETTGIVLKNIIEDNLEEYDDLSVNDRVSILLEMIEKITR